MLIDAGAEVTGYALAPQGSENLFDISEVEGNIHSIIGDIRDFDSLRKAFREAKPEIALHLAAQPLVRESYERPHYTYETNVMGTVNFLECIRENSRVRSVVNVTTDKVYLNREWEWGYREDEQLDGYDPYSNSKSCSELVTHSYHKAFFARDGIAVSTSRAGNVIGGGDFAKDRIIPDCIRAARAHREIIVRNPYSVRPYQHVIEPLAAYLMIAQKQYEDKSYEGYYNVGPDDYDCVSTGRLVELFCEKWGESLSWVNKHDGGPHEANYLKLDCSKIKNLFSWGPKWHIDDAVEKTVQWTKAFINKKDISLVMTTQIEDYINKGEVN
jgi:CDP-glucose 4,6-dehydratase